MGEPVNEIPISSSIAYLDSSKCLNLIEGLHEKLNHLSEDETQLKKEAELLVESFRKIIDQYQEQPELLDPYLSDIIQRLTHNLDDFNISDVTYHTVFKFLYQLIKVSGFKTIGKKFPHEVAKLPLLIELLGKEDTADKQNWQTRYVLTVWLSIVILAPFDLSKFDADSTSSSISEVVYSLLTNNLAIFDSCQHVTAYCLAKFLSRSDIYKSPRNYVQNFIDITLTELANVKLGIANSMDDIKLIGFLRTLAYMFKFLPRAQMKLHTDKILAAIQPLDLDKINRELVNHLIIKVIQRAGLSILPLRTASWRYKRGCRSIGRFTVDKETSDGGVAVRLSLDKAVSGAPFEGESNDVNKSKLEANHSEEVDNLQDCAEEIGSAETIESILGFLFTAIQNSQTRVRWSAGKGVARLANRLSRARTSEVIDLILDTFFNPTNSSDYAWHGGSLALAEMSRHGLILEEKLARVTDLVGKAIIYEKVKGSMAVGAHVREAACYVVWALARSYEDHLLAPHIPSITGELLCSMLFDREVHCRRAASATFQELVGRQGSFDAKEISLLTSLDYQSVGQRVVLYLQLAPEVAGKLGTQFSHKFVNHLLDKKIGHSDIVIRRLASESLSALLLHCEPEFIKPNIVDRLCANIEQDSDNNLKHGAMLSLAKVIKSLVALEFPFDESLIKFVANMANRCDRLLKNKSQGPNFMEAIGFIISSAATAKFEYSPESGVLEAWQSISLSALDSDSAQLRSIGSDALATLYTGFYRADKRAQDRILTYLNTSLSSANESTRCGALKALSKLIDNPQHASQEVASSSGGIRTDADTPDLILMSITSYISGPTQEKDLTFANAKASACEALVSFLKRLDTARLIVSSQLIGAGFPKRATKIGVDSSRQLNCSPSWQTPKRSNKLNI